MHKVLGYDGYFRVQLENGNVCQNYLYIVNWLANLEDIILRRWRFYIAVQRTLCYHKERYLTGGLQVTWSMSIPRRWR